MYTYRLEKYYHMLKYVVRENGGARIAFCNTEDQAILVVGSLNGTECILIEK